MMLDMELEQVLHHVQNNVVQAKAAYNLLVDQVFL